MRRTTQTTPRKEATQARSQATVTAILRATARVLVREGYDSASTNKIARAAGVSIGSLYQYFPSKEALVAALLEQHLSEINSVIRAEIERVAHAPLREAVTSTVRLMIAAHAVDPALHKVFAEQVPRIGRLERMSASLHEEMTAFVQGYLAERKEPLAVTDLALAAFVVVHMVEALTHAAVLTRPDLLGEPFEREVSAAVLRYLTGRDS